MDQIGYSTTGNKFGQLTLSPRGNGLEHQQSVGGGLSDNTAHLKGKLNNLYDNIRALQEQLSTHKKEMQILRGEKETLESVLTMK